MKNIKMAFSAVCAVILLCTAPLAETLYRYFMNNALDSIYRYYQAKSERNLHDLITAETYCIEGYENFILEEYGSDEKYFDYMYERYYEDFGEDFTSEPRNFVFRPITGESLEYYLMDLYYEDDIKLYSSDLFFVVYYDEYISGSKGSDVYERCAIVTYSMKTGWAAIAIGWWADNADYIFD